MYNIHLDVFQGCFMTKRITNSHFIKKTDQACTVVDRNVSCNCENRVLKIRSIISSKYSPLCISVAIKNTLSCRLYIRYHARTFKCLVACPLAFINVIKPKGLLLHISHN